MTKQQITIEEALKLVSFIFDEEQGWQVKNVKGTVFGNVLGDVKDSVRGDVTVVLGNVHTVGGDVCAVCGNVQGNIDGRKWKFVETPKDKLKRLIEESGDHDLLKTFNQMENN